MSTTKKQRIGIWVITACMALGTLGSFGMIVLSTINSQNETERVNALLVEYQAAQDAQTAELSDKYFDTFNSFVSRVGEFDAASVTELQTEDLIVGTGDSITSTSSFTAYYIGWMPSGEIFDSSISDDGLSLSDPYSVTAGSVIEGWSTGADGMKVGGVRELTIPSDLAYGEDGSGDIPADTPLKFIIMIIPTPDAVEMPEELINYYTTGSL